MKVLTTIFEPTNRRIKGREKMRKTFYSDNTEAATLANGDLPFIMLFINYKKLYSLYSRIINLYFHKGLGVRLQEKKSMVYEYNCLLK